MTFKDIFPGLSRSWNFQEKKSRTFQEAWEPCIHSLCPSQTSNFYKLTDMKCSLQCHATLSVIMSNLLQGVCVSPICISRVWTFFPVPSWFISLNQHNDNLNLVTVSVNVTFEKRQNYLFVTLIRLNKKKEHDW